MNGQKNYKLKKILQMWPYGTVATLQWLDKFGVYRQLADRYVRSGWLERIGSGAYVKSGDETGFFGAVYALQVLCGKDVHPGGKTALGLNGYAHFLPVDLKQYKTELYLGERVGLPLWFHRQQWAKNTEFIAAGLFSPGEKAGLSEYDFGSYRMNISSSERAMVELCYRVSEKAGYDEAFYIMQGLNTLRPGVLSDLLEKCRSIRVKRLFLHMAEACGHDWMKKIDSGRIFLGKGARQFYKGGVYDKKYKITVPENNYER